MNSSHHKVAMYRLMYLLLYVILALMLPQGVSAEHPIDVERAAADGEYLKAMVDYTKLPQRIVTENASIAYAKSAWALGLPQVAIDTLETTLSRFTVLPQRQAEILLTRGIIELQEHRPQIAALYAERALTSCGEGCPYPAQIYLVWGDAAQKLGSLGAAQNYYESALDASKQHEESEILYRLGVLRYKLGSLKEARQNLELIPLTHERAPQALRYLGMIALASGDAVATKIYLTKGREQFPQHFLDSWTDYALIRAAIIERDSQQVQALRKEAFERFAPSDPWILLLDAASEGFLWSQQKGETR
jgi:tetratricopeptide (TPR) repeat protein